VQQRSIPAPHRWHNPLLVCSLHPVQFFLLVRCNKFAMPRHRPRGRPKRGSPWKPRRPLVTSSDSTSGDSSPPRHATTIPVSLRAPQLSSMAIISRTPISILRLSHDPQSFLPAQCLQAALRTIGAIILLLTRHPSGQVLATRRTLTESSSQRAWPFTGFGFRASARGRGFKVSIPSNGGEGGQFHAHSLLYARGPVLRPGRHPSHRASRGHHRSGTDQHADFRSSRMAAEGAQGRQQGPAGTNEADEQWDYGVTYIEEEPCPGDLPATWPNYKPTV
jgi:hypothetical protein